MTGNQRVLEFLRDRRWHTTGEIARGCEVTAHSRLAELRKQGHVIEKRTNRGGTGYGKFSYRLVQTALERQLQDESLEESASVPARGLLGADSSNDTSAAAAELQGMHFDEAAADDMAWRDRFGPDIGNETLPPPVDGQQQLLLEGAA